MSSIYLHLQNTVPSSSVPSNGPIMFDKTPLMQSEGINWLASTGMVILDIPGTYLVEWSVAASSVSSIEIGLEASTSPNPIIGNTLLATSEVCGSAIIVVPEEQAVSLRLLNKSASALSYAPGLPVLANMVIYSYVEDDAAVGGAGGKLLNLSFCSATGPTCLPSIDASGRATTVSIIGTSRSSDIPINFSVSGTIIQIPFGTDNSQYLFSFPYDVKLKAVSAIFNNYSSILLNLPTTNISPFITVATQAIPGTYTFDIREEAATYASPGYQMLRTPPQDIPASTVLTAVKTNLDLLIPAGQPFAIVGGLINLGLSTQALSLFIYMHGSMVFEIVD